jgi:hypothetical protein
MKGLISELTEGGADGTRGGVKDVFEPGPYPYTVSRGESLRSHAKGLCKCIEAPLSLVP